jgi:protein involved in polysaccharide export with SLBB domain
VIMGPWKPLYNRKIACLRVAGKLACVIVFSLLIISVAAFAQEKETRTDKSNTQTSELAKDNLDRVAASEAQIAAVLKGNPGLLVELKRWMAKDASDRGQLIQDEDLEDAAVFARLAREQKFRAVATRLLQRYGYLLAKLNPESEAGLEQDALIKERVRQRAAAEQAIPAPLTQPEERGNPNRLNCDPIADRDEPDCQKQMKATRERKGADFNSSGQTGDRDTYQTPPDRTIDFTGANPGQVQTGLNSVSRGNVGDLSQQIGLQSELGNLPMPGTRPGLADSATSQNDRTVTGSELETTNRTNRTNREEPRKKGSFETESTEISGPPATTRHWSPYSDIPSVYDMFSHSVVPSGKVQRFGEEMFRNIPEVSNTIPIDLPASADYVLGPGDGLTISLWGGVSQRLERTVDREGRIALPDIGPVVVNGQTLAAAQQSIQQQLRTQLKNISVDISLTRLRTVRVYVVGEAEHAGAYDVSSLSTPLNALLASGGPTPEGSLRIVKHYRGDELIQKVDLYDLLLHGVRTDIKHLEPGDTLLVPPAGAQIRVDGMVRRPAIYELNGETTLAQALDMAGGILPTAALSHIEVQRLEAHEKRTMLSLDISGAADQTAIEAKLSSFSIRDRDEIHIFPIASFNQDAIYLEGHVIRAGRYAYKPGMKFTDLISSYSDLLPEPATKYAEIIRLNPPDYHPSVESFDLGAALLNPAAAPELHPLDTVRIFNRFELENPPTVSVSGAVRQPGTFQPPGQIRVRDAIQLAGGISPDASMDSAQVIRVSADGSLKVLSIRLKEALAGDPNNNLMLEPRDRVMIQQNLLRVDPPSVLVGGEVVNPGRYILTGNLHVSDAIEMAGGLNRSADSDSADLMEYVPSNTGPLVASHLEVNVTEALAHDSKQDLTLHDGDVLTIRQVRGWGDLRAVIHIEGEVQHPGTYGIHPGERLSSVLERAGGFEKGGYPYGAILERGPVRELEVKEQDALLLRVKQAKDTLTLEPDGDPKQKLAKELAIQQWQSSIDQLTANPPVGRVAIHISSDINRWKNTSADIEVRAGDTLVVPKKPGYVLVSGQAFNPTALTYHPGRSASWYLSQAGGPTTLANKKAVFVIRADGSVIGGKSGLWSGSSLGVALQPGDIVVVPEKALTGNIQFQNVLLIAQVAASIASAIFIAIHG